MDSSSKLIRATYVAILALVLLAPVLGLYPVFVMKLLCFALFACAFNLLCGQGGMLSFGHSAYFGVGVFAEVAAGGGGGREVRSEK